MPQPWNPAAHRGHMTYRTLLPEASAYINATNDIRPQILVTPRSRSNFCGLVSIYRALSARQGWILHNPGSMVAFGL